MGLLALLAAAAPAEAAPPHAALELETLEGDALRLAPEAKGSLVVHFWATWCPSCLEELPLLEAAAGACQGAGLRVLAVNVGESVETIEAFFESGAELEMARDPRGRVWRELSGIGLPTNLIWTESERRVDVGPRSLAEWQAELAALGCGAQLAPE